MATLEVRERPRRGQPVPVHVARWSKAQERATHQDLRDRATPALDARLAPGEALTALVVDDNAASRRILASLLESAGVRVMTAAGGVEALELARGASARSRLDGSEDARSRRPRGDPPSRDRIRDRGTIPVIAVTASALGDVRQTVHDAGCVDYLSKPVRAELLFAMLQRHLGVRFVSETEPASRARRLRDRSRSTHRHCGAAAPRGRAGRCR